MKFYYLLALASATIIGASRVPQTELEHDDTDWLPDLRLSRREVDEMKANLEHPAGSIIGNATFDGDEAREALTVPVVLVDPEWLLEGTEGDKNREIARRQGITSSCLSLAGFGSSCSVSYCWRKVDDNVIVNSHVTITRTPNPFGSSYSISRVSPDKNKLDIVFVDQSKGKAYTWEPGHTCNDANPFVHTIHRVRGSIDPFSKDSLLSYTDLQNGKAAWTKIGQVNCRTCYFGYWSCAPAVRKEMVIFTNGAGTGTQCI